MEVVAFHTDMSNALNWITDYLAKENLLGSLNHQKLVCIKKIFCIFTPFFKSLSTSKKDNPPFQTPVNLAASLQTLAMVTTLETWKMEPIVIKWMGVLFLISASMGNVL